jgi:hypothetical protein
MFKEKFYKIFDDKRIYNHSVTNFDLFSSEMLVNLNNHINLGYKIYYLKCESNHNFSLNNDELKYLYTIGERRGEPLYFVFSPNVETIKKSQKFDLFFLMGLKNLGLLILIPKLDNGDKYYFNLILAVKSGFDIEKLYNFNFNSIILNSVLELNMFNLSESYIKNIFDFENNKFKDNNVTREESDLWFNELLDKNSEFSKLSKKGIRVLKKIIFKHVCFHLYWLDGEYQTNDTMFQIDYGYKEKILVPHQNGDFKIIKSYHNYCLEDLISCNPEFFCFS